MHESKKLREMIYFYSKMIKEQRHGENFAHNLIKVLQR